MESNPMNRQEACVFKVGQAVSGNPAVRVFRCKPHARAANQFIFVRNSLFSEKPETKHDKVAIVTFAGSGHFPYPTGFIGKGMLHAACTGTTYCPPSSDVICAMLDIVSSRLSNILFIYLNHQNDKLKLRHALKVFRTRRPEVEIDSVRIQDDIAKVDSTSSRGLAGALLVIKIVGAAAESGLALNALKTLAEETACSVVTYGAALLPSVRRAEHDEPHEQYSKPVQLGLGLHGETAAECANWNPVDNEKIVEHMCTRIDECLSEKYDVNPAAPNEDGRPKGLVILINNLGSLSPTQMLEVQHTISEFLFHKGGNLLSRRKFPIHVYSGALMTAFETFGVSISCMVLHQEHRRQLFALTAETDASAWKNGFDLWPSQNHPQMRLTFADSCLEVLLPTVQISRPTLHDEVPMAIDEIGAPTFQDDAPMEHSLPVRQQDSGSVTETSRVPRSKSELCVLQVARALADNADAIGVLEERAGNGNLRNELLKCCECLIDDVLHDRLAFGSSDTAWLFQTIAYVIGTTAPGSCGELSAAFFSRVASDFENLGYCGTKVMWRRAIMLGTAAIKDYGEAKQYERTLLDALIPAANVAERDGTLQQAAKAASTGCESTRHMKGNHGRSGHVRACVLRDYEDAGARMVCVILDELIKVNLIP